MSFLTAKIRLRPTPEQAEQMLASLHTFNAACSWVASRSVEAGKRRRFDISYLVYHEVRERFGLHAEMTLRCIGRVASALKSSKGAVPVFRPDAAQSHRGNTVKIGGDSVTLTLAGAGRVTIEASTAAYQRRLLQHTLKEGNLVTSRGGWYLLAVVECADAPMVPADDWLGVDLGIVNIATDSDGKVYSGAAVDASRAKASRRIAALQRRGTKAAKRRLKRLSGKQRRYQRHVNHEISKAIVTTAEHTSRGIGLEELTNIRERVTVKRSQRARHSNWSFWQLRTCIEYKAALAGVQVAVIDPRNTSRQCSCCGHIDAANRRTQEAFKCTSCGHADRADINAAQNIRARASSAALRDAGAKAHGRPVMASADPGTTTSCLRP